MIEGRRYRCANPGCTATTKMWRADGKYPDHAFCSKLCAGKSPVYNGYEGGSRNPGKNPGRLSEAEKRKRASARQKAWYRKNKEKAAAYQREYRKRNREEIAAKQALYYRQNRETIIGQVKKYQRDNVEAVREYQRRHYREHGRKRGATR